MSDLLNRLQQVIDSGQPAQAERAGALMADVARAIEENDVTSTAIVAAEELTDAYLHDPYLTREP